MYVLHGPISAASGDCGLDEDCHQNYLELGVRGPVAHFSSLRSGPFGPAPHVLPILTFLFALNLSPCPLSWPKSALAGGSSSTPSPNSEFLGSCGFQGLYLWWLPPLPLLFGSRMFLWEPGPPQHRVGWLHWCSAYKPGPLLQA